jgi:arsenical pump membrane protein
VSDYLSAVSIFALTVTLSLSRPRIGPIRVHHAAAAVLGSSLALAVGLVPLPLLLRALRMLAFPVITIVSLMVITLVAERAGVLDGLARRVAVAAQGDGHRLFAYLFICGTATGTVFTNDAAILIFTPLVFGLIEEVAEPTWTPRNKIPFYFAVLYVGNLVGALVISNPINIIVSSIFDIGFFEYACWMVIPAVVSMAVSYLGLKVVFRKSIPTSYRSLPPEGARPHDPFMAKLCGVVLAITLVGFFSDSLTRIPIWGVALAGALTLLVVHRYRGGSVTRIARGVGWDVIIFLIGIFLIAMALRNVGFAHQLGSLITVLADDGIGSLTTTTSFVAASCSSLLNNHPTSGLMIWVIQDIARTGLETKMLVFGALIGGDLGPKMLPIGSLAALMWFRMLRDRGVRVPYTLYIKIGIPVTLLAVLASVVTLNLERILFTWLIR